jgi:hypothetical protein
MRSVRRKLCVYFCLFIGLGLPIALHAQEPVEELPPVAKEAVEKGLAAAGQKEWKLAIRYFEEARKAAPHSPIALYNLALAEMQIPGRELRPVAFFEAYLLAAPQTDKAAAIRTQVANLELKTEANTGVIIDMLKSLANKYAAGSYEQRSAQQSIAVLQAHAGDVDAAMAGAQQLASDSSFVTFIGNIAGALAEESHFDEAKRLAGQITEPTNRSGAFYSVLDAQAKQGLIDDARTTLAQISGDPFARLALCELAKAEFKAGDSEHALQRLARADELTKAMPVKDQNAKSSRNNALHTVAQVHLEVNDWRGAKAIVPLLFNEKGFAYQDSLVDYVTRKLAELRDEKIKAGDLDGAEAMVDALPGVAQRAGSYAYLAGQPAVKENPERLSSLARKTEALLASAKRAKEKFVIASALSDLAILRHDPASAARWRQQAIAVSGAALQEPENRQESELYRYRLAGELCRQASGAVTAKEEASLRKVMEAARAALAKPDNIARSYLVTAGRTAVVALAAQTHKEADVNAAIKFVQDFAKDLSVSDIKAIATNFEDPTTADKILNLIPDSAERAKAFNENSVRKYGKQFEDAIKRADFAAASKAMAQLPDGSDKITKQASLIVALAGQGDFAAAEKNAAGLPDEQTRLSALASIAYQRADAGDHAAPNNVWQQKKSLLAAITDPIKRLNLQWDLYGYPERAELTRDAMPGYFEETLALPDPKARVEQLRLIVLAANRAGLFSVQREARAEALMIAASTKDAETLPISYFDLNTSECLEQASGPARESFLQAALNNFAASGNISDVQAVGTKLSAKSADHVQSALASALAERGDFAATRAAQEKITDKYERGSATRAVVHAFVKAGNLVAAKDYAEHLWPESESAGDAIIREMAAAGEVAWASQQVKRLGNIYGPGAGAAVTAIQMAKGDLSGADAAFAQCRYDSDRAQLMRAAADSGHLDLAIKWMKSSNSGLNEVVAAQVRAGNLEGARALATQAKRNTEKVGALRALAVAQAKKGDLDGARVTFQSASKEDKRTSPDLGAESFISRQLAVALADRPDFAAATTTAASVTDPYWRDQAFLNIVASAASTDASATQTALKAVSDPLLRSKSIESAVDLALKVNHLNDALAYADLAPDEGFRAVSLGAALNYGIDHGDISDVLPHVLALQDPAAKAWLLIDALRGSVFLELKTGDTNLPATASAAVASMPVNFWQARMSADLARFAGKLDPASAPALRDKTLACAQALTGDDAARWQRYVESAKKSAEVVQTSPAVAVKEDKVQTARTDAIDSWENLLQSNSSLNAPIFIDFKATIDGLPSSVPSSSEYKAAQLFSNVQQQAQQLISTLKEVRTLRKKSANDIATAAKSAARS